MIFIADTGHKKVLAATLGAYKFRSLVPDEDIEVWDVTFSEVNQKLYWASKHNGHIYQANANGTGVKQVSSTSHTGMNKRVLTLWCEWNGVRDAWCRGVNHMVSIKQCQKHMMSKCFTHIWCQ